MIFDRTIAALGVAAVIAVSGASAASAAMFDFRNGSLGANGTYGSPTPIVSVGGIGVSASGGTYAFDTIVDTDSLNVTKSNSGLGVDCIVFAGLCPNEIDGPFDLLTLNFDQVVDFVSALFTEVDGDDDFDLFVDGVLVEQDVAITGNNPFSLIGYRGMSISFGADAGTLTNLNEDDFRLGAITVTPVPLPAAGWMLLAGLGGIAAMKRRRKAA